MSLSANLVAFAVLAAAVWLAGTRLSYLADAIGDRTGIGHALMGLVFLAGITELPELVTTGTAAWQGDAALALNNMFGGIVMQTAILAVADAAVPWATLTTFPRKPTPILEGVMLVFLLALILLIVSIGEIALIGGVGVGAVLLAVVYCLAIYTLNRFDQREVWRPVELSEPLEEERAGREVLAERSLRSLALRSAASAAVILVCGVLLVQVASAIAAQSGLGSSFVGVTLLATATSLPELSTTIAAARMGAYTMAISNIFGSNLIMVFVLFPADLLYREGEILHRTDATGRLALLAGILVTAVYLVGLLVKRKPRVLGMGIDSIAVLVIYLASLVAFYRFR
jgi:cation:H+ antiporter